MHIIINMIILIVIVVIIIIIIIINIIIVIVIVVIIIIIIIIHSPSHQLQQHLAVAAAQKLLGSAVESRVPATGDRRSQEIFVIPQQQCLNLPGSAESFICFIRRSSKSFTQVVLGKRLQRGS